MSDKLLSKIHDFDRSLSNHFMLSCIRSVNFVEYMPELYNLHLLLIKYVWNSSIEKFQNALQSAENSVALPHDATGLSAVCDCGIS